jgi:heme oxygenase (biliverdin-producing, ferredoxin)
MSLKDLTWENHKNAERQEFVKILLSGKINKTLYAIYLYNQYHIYNNLEKIAENLGLLSDLPDLKRANYIYEDFKELWDKKDLPEVCYTVRNYISYLDSIHNDSNKIMAHIYVRHMGDLSGGQMISKKVPGSGNFYKFIDSEELKTKIRNKLSDDMAPEANNCFNYAIELFEELKNICDESGLE